MVPKIQVPANWCTRDVGEVISYIYRVKLIDADDGIAMDTETNSLTIFGNPEFRMVGISLSHGSTGIYLDTADMTYATIRTCLRHLRSTLRTQHKSLICHNLFYDMSVTRFYLGRGFDLPYIADTYGLARYLASEGFFGQQWGLKFFQKSMLLWGDTNETDRDEWMIAQGLVNNQGKPNKGDMYKCPAHILGPYCILDSYSTYHLYREILLTSARKYATDLFLWFHREVFINTLVTECVTNYEEGIFIDRDILSTYDVKLTRDILSTKRNIYLQHKSVIDTINRELLGKHMQTCPEHRYKVVKKPTGVCPAKYAKNGRISKNYLKFTVRMRKFERDVQVGGPITKNYAAFRAYRRELLHYTKRYPIYDPENVPEQFKPYMCNLNSTAHKSKILYTDLHIEVLDVWVSEKNPGAFLLPNGIELSYNRKSGALPTGKSALLSILGSGSALAQFNGEIKKQQFTRAVLNKLTAASRIHLPVKVPGTLTCRLGGDGGVNIQNTPKDPMFQSAWRVENPHTHVIADIDKAALEPHVLTALSQDPAMLGLYGPGAKPNDVYIYFCALIGGALGQPFLDEGYDPYNPTADAIARCKKNHKKLRGAGKTLILSSDYGAGTKKQFTTLRIQGYDFSLAQVKRMHDKLNEVCAGKMAFGKKLEAEHERNGGYILDGLGFPTAVDVMKRKDLINRTVQKTGHMIEMLFLYKTMQLFRQYNVPYSWMIVDYHDATDPIIPIEYVPIVKDIYIEALRWVNDDFLKTSIRIKGTPQFATNMAEIKCEDYKLDNEEIADLIEELNADE